MLRWDGMDVDQALLERMSGRIAHRGPDDCGAFVAGPIGLAHRRLSILDLSDGGHQPMCDPRHAGVVAYNGEIYNFRELRQRLEIQGHPFGSQCDTEVLLRACLAWGIPAAAKLFNGMFAFAFWDANKQELWLARDRTGIKPLYYYRSRAGVMFASEIKALLPEVAGELDEGSLLTLLMGGPPQEPQTLFRNIKAVEGGQFICISPGGVWNSGRFLALEDEVDPELYGHLKKMPEKEVIRTVSRLLEDSVRLHLLSDAKLATMASGGLDSSLISCLANEQLDGLGLYHADVGGSYSEVDFARALARHSRQELRVATLTPESYLQQFVQVSFINECPIAQHPNTVPFYQVCRLAAEDGVKVLLTGEGADELFGGYSAFREMMRRRRVGKWRKRFTNFFRYLGMVRVGRLVDWLTEADSHAGFESRAFGVVTHGRILLPIEAGRRAYSFLDDPIERDLQVDLFGYLHSYLQSILWRNDRMGMAVGLESRVPYLENELIRYALNLPAKYKIRGRNNKWILRRVAETLLPPELSHRRKMGFPVDAAAFLPRNSAFFADGFLESWLGLGHDQLLALCKRFPEMHVRLMAVEAWGQVFLQNLTPSDVTDKLVRTTESCVLSN